MHRLAVSGATLIGRTGGPLSPPPRSSSSGRVARRSHSDTSSRRSHHQSTAGECSSRPGRRHARARAYAEKWHPEVFLGRRRHQVSTSRPTPRSAAYRAAVDRGQAGRDSLHRSHAGGRRTYPGSRVSAPASMRRAPNCGRRAGGCGRRRIKLYVTVRPDTRVARASEPTRVGCRSSCISTRPGAGGGARRRRLGRACSTSRFFFSSRPQGVLARGAREAQSVRVRWLALAVARRSRSRLARGPTPLRRLDRGRHGARPDARPLRARPGPSATDVGDSSMDDPERLEVLPLLPAAVGRSSSAGRAPRRGPGARSLEASDAAAGTTFWHSSAASIVGWMVLAGTIAERRHRLGLLAASRARAASARRALSDEAIVAATRRPAERLGRRDGLLERSAGSRRRSAPAGRPIHSPTSGTSDGSSG